MSLINCRPQEDNYYNKYDDRIIKFPEPFSSDHDFHLFAEDRVSSVADKLIKSGNNGWSVIAQQLASDGINHAVRRATPSDEIIFPDQQLPVKNSSFIPVVKGEPSCAQGKSFCEKTDNYPRSHMKNILQKDEIMYRSYFGKDVIPQTKFIANRIDETEKSLCAIKESVVFPQVAENKDGKWLYIANVDNYIQGVRIEECGQPSGSACDKVASFPLGYTASCQQKYIYRKLIALDNSGKSISDSFRLPACCACMVKLGISDRSLINAPGDEMKMSDTEDPKKPKNQTQ